MSAGQAAEEEADAAAASPTLPRVLSALFYGMCSFLTVLVNKALLSAYSFPSPMFLGIGQMAATILILYVSKLNKIVHFPDFDKSIPVKVISCVCSRTQGKFPALLQGSDSIAFQAHISLLQNVLSSCQCELYNGCLTDMFILNAC